MPADIAYEPNATVGPLNPARVREFEESFSVHREKTTKLPPSYIAHLSRNHGAVPRQRCFATQRGAVRVIGRFLNFLTPEDIRAPFFATWRRGTNPNGPGAEDDIRLDYSAFYLGHDGPHWEKTGEHLAPFAGLDTNGHDCRNMAEFDLLCFDYSKGPSPAVVTLDFQRSNDDRQFTEPVAPSWDAFLTLLATATVTSPIAQEPTGCPSCKGPIPPGVF